MLRIESRINGTIGRLRYREGFTLVEVMVTVLIFAILMAAIHTTLLVGQSSWQTNSVRAELGQELRKAVDRMKDDLRQTGSAAITNVPINPEVDSVTYPDPDDDPAYAWYTTITFQAVSDVINGAVVWETDITQFVAGEDLDGDSNLDAGEDINSNGVLDVPEDADGDDVLGSGEDINGNGKLDAGARLQKVVGSTHTVIAQDIETLRIRRLFTAPDIIEVELSAQKVTADGRTINLGVSFEVQMRN